MPGTSAPLAKLAAPRIDNALTRGRLFRLLDAALAHCPIVWIVGVPGAGKTTLVSSYLRAKKRPTVWYTMDPGDSDLATLFHWLARGATVLAPKKRAAFAPLTAERRAGFDMYVRSFFETLGERLPKKATLVFDDHQEGGGDAFAEVIAKGLPFLRTDQRIVIVSRQEPPAILAALEVKHKMFRVTDEALRLDLEETRALARARNPRQGNEPRLELIHERTRGWAAGLVMLLDQPASSDVPDVVLDYLAQEYVDRLPEATREGLSRLALAPSVTKRMATALGAPEMIATLARLARRGAFVARREGVTPTYEVHPLLRELLVRRVEHSLDAAALVDRRRAVASVCAEEGNVETAATLYAASGDFDRLVALVDAHGPALTSSGQTERIERWLELLPPVLHAHDPRIAMWLGRCASGKDPARARKYFEAAYVLLESMGSVEGQLGAWAGIVLNILATFDDMKALDPWIAKFDALVPSVAMPHVRSAYLLVGLVSAVTYRSFDHPRLDEWLLRSVDVLETDADEPAALLALAWGVAGTFMDLGDIQRAEHVRALAARIAARAGADPQLAIFAALTEGSVAARSGDGEAAERALLRGERAAAAAGIPVWNHLYARFGATAAFARDDLAQARSQIAELVPRTTQATGRLGRAQHAQFAAQLHLREGALGPALEEARGALRHTANLGTLVPEAQCQLLIAEIHLARDEPELAAASLDAIDARSDFARSRNIEAQARFARMDVGRHADRIEATRRAFALARTHGVGLLVSAATTPETIVRRCLFALAEGIEPETACAVLKARARDTFTPPAWLERWSWAVRVQLLGRFQVVVGARALKLGPKPQVRVLELLQLLVVKRGSASEAQLIDALWPESDGDRALRSLAIAVHRLRAMLGDPTLVERRAGRISLDRRRIFADLWAIEALLEEAKSTDPLRRRALHASARRLHVGPPAPVRSGNAPAWLVGKGQQLERMLERDANRTEVGLS